MGNIKQESKFHSNIYEGGARVSYSDAIGVVMVLFSGPLRTVIWGWVSSVIDMNVTPVV